MAKLTPLVFALGFGLFIGKFHGEMVEPVGFLGAKFPSVKRDLASSAAIQVANDITGTTPAPSAQAVSEASVTRYLKEIGINKATEIYRKTEMEFRTDSITGQFQDFRRFTNFVEHERWIEKLGQKMYKKSRQWRGLGTILLGGQTAEVELHLIPAHEEIDGKYPCYSVEAFVRMNGGLLSLTTEGHCSSNLLFKDGDYYLTWSVYDQLGTATDLAMLTVALPQSKSELVKYLIDGDPEWQSSAFTWTPVSEIDRQSRISQLSHEMVKGGQ